MLKQVPSRTLHLLIEALRLDIQLGYSGARYALKACQAEVRRRSAMDYARNPWEYLYLRSQTIAHLYFKVTGRIPGFVDVVFRDDGDSENQA